MKAIYNLTEVVNFIEKYHNIKLYDYQKKMLECVIEGRQFSSPKHTGRKTILNGYIEYLKTTHGRHLMRDEADIHIELEEVVKESKKHQIIIDELNELSFGFRVEYESKWVGDNES